MARVFLHVLLVASTGVLIAAEAPRQPLELWLYQATNYDDLEAFARACRP